MKPATITMYYWGGEKFGIRIKSACEECDVNRAILHDMQEKEFKDKPIAVEIKPWFTNVWKSLAHGGWHAPVVIVNGKLLSQGIVIDREKLTKRIYEHA